MKKILYIPTFLLQMIINETTFASEEVPPPELLWPAVRMFSVLAILLGIIFFALYIFKRLNFQHKGLLGNQRNMQLMETLYLGPKRSIALLKVGQELFLLGISPNQVNFLSKVEWPSECEKEPGPKGPDFSQIIGKTKEGYAKAQNIQWTPKGLKKLLSRFGMPETVNQVTRERI